MGNFRFDIPEAAMKSENKSNFLVYNFCIKKACLTIQKLDRLLVVLGGKSGSNRRPSEPQSDALTN